MIAHLLIVGGIGLAAGIVASGVMELYQYPAVRLFRLPDSKKEPSTVMAANALSVLLIGHALPVAGRAAAGRAVHYLTGAALGLIYAIVAAVWPPATIGFGLAFGAVVWIGLDLVGVPSFGWGNKPWEAPLRTLLYALSAHLVFGVASEGARRGLTAFLA